MGHNLPPHNCVFCNSPLSAATPVEHIIPQGIGGRLASRKITCGTCNDKLNHSLDAHLVKHFSHLINLLSIGGTKGKPHPVRVKYVDRDEECKLRFGGVVEDLEKVKITRHPDGTTSTLVIGSSVQEMNALMTQAKKSMKEVFKTEVLSTPNDNEYAAGDMVQIPFSTGDERVHRAIARIAVNFYAYHSLPRSFIEPINKYILGEAPGYVVNPYFPLEPAWEKLPDRTIAHSIQIRSFPNQGLLVAIVELFNVFRYYVVLNPFYLGKEISETHSYDVIARKLVHRSPCLSFDSRDAFFQHQRPPEDLPERILREGTDFLNLVGFHRLRPHLGKLYPINGKENPERVEITMDNIDSLAPLLHKSLGKPVVRTTRK